jgi:hypothetical protein
MQFCRLCYFNHPLSTIVSQGTVPAFVQLSEFRRFRGSVAAGELRAKTGTLGGTAALSGYYKDIVFSIMVNNVAHAGSHADIVSAVDQVAVALCAAADTATPTSRL